MRVNKYDEELRKARDAAVRAVGSAARAPFWTSSMARAAYWAAIASHDATYDEANDAAYWSWQAGQSNQKQVELILKRIKK